MPLRGASVCGECHHTQFHWQESCTRGRFCARPRETVVYKYALPSPCDEFSLELPVGARVLRVAMQRGARFLWARVDPLAPKEICWFRWAGTGHILSPDVWDHVGTWEESDGALVWHLFRLPGPTKEPSR